MDPDKYPPLQGKKKDRLIRGPLGPTWSKIWILIFWSWSGPCWILFGCPSPELELDLEHLSFL